jgi:hypothetical protein
LNQPASHATIISNINIFALTKTRIELAPKPGDPAQRLASLSTEMGTKQSWYVVLHTLRARHSKLNGRKHNDRRVIGGWWRIPHHHCEGFVPPPSGIFEEVELVDRHHDALPRLLQLLQDFRGVEVAGLRAS